MHLIDTHAHLDELSNPDLAIDKAKEVGVMAIVAVGSGLESNMKTLEIARKYDSFVYPALGLHPWELANLGLSRIEETLRLIEERIADAIAIGEIGLDYDKRVVKVASKELQKEVLGRLLSLAIRYAKPAIIHSRYAWKDAFQLVQDSGVEKAVFHWFTGFPGVLKAIIGSDYLVSATPAAEYHQEHRRAVREAPLEKLVLETDCPVTYGREERYESRPADVLRTLKAVAEIKEVDEATVTEQTSRNAIGFFSLNMPLR